MKLDLPVMLVLSVAGRDDWHHSPFARHAIRWKVNVLSSSTTSWSKRRSPTWAQALPFVVVLLVSSLSSVRLFCDPMDCGPQGLPYPLPSFSACPFLALLTLDQSHNQTGAAHEQWHHHQQTQVHQQSLLITHKTSELLTDPGRWSCWGVEMGTETLTLVLQTGRRGPLSFSPSVGMEWRGAKD